jgi:3-hydroxyacyl-CoA dehydrogenase
MANQIRTAAVLGSGVMGAQIAAHLANVGIPVLLLDIVPRELGPDDLKAKLTADSPAFRNKIAAGAIARLKTMKPSPVYSQAVLPLLTPGNFEDDLAKLAGVDLVIEAVVERLDIKQSLWGKVAQHVRPGTILATNTSGLPIAKISEGLPASCKSHFLGAHFFNPPRYLKLLELIPTPETDPAVLAFMTEFGERVLGKGIVQCKDTPNFIANRIGTYGMQVTLQAMFDSGLGADEIDSLTGPIIGRPKSATFRTLDVVGLDTYVHVSDNCRAALADRPAEAAVFEVPAKVREMIERGWLGQKAKQGFFKKVGDEILTLDLETMEYRPRKKTRFPCIDEARKAPDLAGKLQAIVYGDDPGARFVWRVFKETLLYSAKLLGEIADDIRSIDNALKWGFGWAMGPFETWDAIGIRKALAKMEAEGAAVPAWVQEAAAAGGFYRRTAEGLSQFVPGQGYIPVVQSERVIEIEQLRAAGKIVKEKKGATLLDMGDGILLLDFHSLKQAIGTDMILMMKQAADLLKQDEWKGLVISSAAENFCVGANLALLLLEAQDDEEDEVEEITRQFQNACMALKYAPKPVVAAPYGLTLGGGYEISAHCDQIVAHAELYMGLVEVGAGLIPGGGGNKELLIRALEALPASSGGLGGAAQMAAGGGIDLQPIVNRVFETIAMAKVSTSAVEAQELGYLRKTDKIVVNRAHQLYEAKQAALRLADGYRAPQAPSIPVLGPDGAAVLGIGVYNMKLSGWASEYDGFIAKQLATVLTGGDVPRGTYVTEQYLLDVERAAFVKLAMQKKSQDRMGYILKTGKPLRN